MNCLQTRTRIFNSGYFPCLDEFEQNGYDGMPGRENACHKLHASARDAFVKESRILFCARMLENERSTRWQASALSYGQ